MDTQDTDRQPYGGRVVAGLIIIAVGLVFLGDSLGFSDVHLSAHFWPLILIVLGLVKIANSRRQLGSGLWLIYLGCWGLVNEFHLFGLDYNTSWPLLIIGSGLLIVWRAIEGPSGTCGRVRAS